MLQRKSSSNTNSSLSSSSTSASPVVQQKSHSRSSSSSSTNSSLQKKAKLNDEMTNRSLNDLSQFVQLNKDERSFLPPAPPNQSNEKETTKSNSSIIDTKFVFLTENFTCRYFEEFFFV
jgi:transcription initiation factor IIF auxiliary subunit